MSVSRYPWLFEPGRIGGVATKNRIVMPALGTGLAHEDGSPSEELLAFYEERLEGGVGLLVTEVTRVNEVNGVGMRRQLGLARDDNVGPASSIAAAARRHGCRLFFQLHHPGRNGHPALNPSGDIVAPSPLPALGGGAVPRELTLGEINGLEEDFVRAAARARAAGADGVELHAAHGYLIGQFLSPYSNKRRDEYGGSFENRTRFLRNVLRGIRGECGDFPVAVRLSVDEFLHLAGVDGEHVGLAEGVRMAKACEDWGAVAIDVSSGIPASGYTTVEPAGFEEGWKGYLAAAVKRAVSAPVIAVNKLRRFERAEAMLEAGEADFVALGRQLLADPAWPRKAEEGRPGDVRYCSSCCACMLGIRAGKPIACAVNPRAGAELGYLPGRENRLR